MGVTDSPSRGQGRGRGFREGNHGGRGTGRPCPLCWNCNSHEHFKAQCPEPDKNQSAGTTHTANGSANAAADSDSKSDRVFAIDELSEFETESSVSIKSSVPDLLTLSESSDDYNEAPFPAFNDDDQFSEVSDDAAMWDDPDWKIFWNIASGNTSDGKEEITAEVHDGHRKNEHTIELYDSGSTCHISPFKELFDTLSTIPPKTFMAANKQLFNAVGIGEMIIEIPNSIDVSKLHLTEVLYSPEVGYTLVSIGCLDELSYSATFADGNAPLEILPKTSLGRSPSHPKACTAWHITKAVEAYTLQWRLYP
jgi:hypothetical protein